MNQTDAFDEEAFVVQAGFELPGPPRREGYAEVILAKDGSVLDATLVEPAEGTLPESERKQILDTILLLFSQMGTEWVKEAAAAPRGKETAH